MVNYGLNRGIPYGSNESMWNLSGDQIAKPIENHRLQQLKRSERRSKGNLGADEIAQPSQLLQLSHQLLPGGESVSTLLFSLVEMYRCYLLASGLSLRRRLCMRRT